MQRARSEVDRSATVKATQPAAWQARLMTVPVAAVTGSVLEIQYVNPLMAACVCDVHVHTPHRKGN